MYDGHVCGHGHDYDVIQGNFVWLSHVGMVMTMIWSKVTLYYCHVCGHGYDYNAVDKGSVHIMDMVMNTGSLLAGFLPRWKP